MKKSRVTIGNYYIHKPTGTLVRVIGLRKRKSTYRPIILDWNPENSYSLFSSVHNPGVSFENFYKEFELSKKHHSPLAKALNG